MFIPGPAAIAVCPSRKAKGQWGDSVRFLPAGLCNPVERNTEHEAHHYQICTP
jgi:hypothetical protein